MTEPQTAILLRYSGEVSTKARPTRRQFSAQLQRNVEDALASHGIPARIERDYDRIQVLLAAGADPALALETLGRVFGIQSLSRAELGDASSLEALVEMGRRIFTLPVKERRFAVRARIVGNQELPYRSRDVEVALGRALEAGAAGVDLTHPEFTARVEIHRGQAFHCVETRRGPGGLPVGTEGTALALVSGGFDSAVAAWQLLRRGVRLEYLFCNLGGRSHELGTLRVMKHIAEQWSYGYRPVLHAVDFEPVSREIQAHAQPRYWQVLLKRFMLRVAESLAVERGAEALVTGEAVGQVSSQTLTNLAAISQATSFLILRPLIGANKDEIIAQARQIGTEALSAVVGEYCALVQRNPSTAARLERLLAEEALLDLGVATSCLAAREEIDLRGTDPEDRVQPEVATDRIPAGAQLLDLRSRAEFESWHPAEAVQLDFDHALRAYASFARDRAYVLYCEFGLKSVQLAELMQAEGFEAYHFRGGTRALRRKVGG